MPTRRRKRGLPASTTLSALGIEALAATALETGSASGTARSGNTSFDVAAMRLGKDARAC